MNHCASKSELPQNIEPTVQDRQSFRPDVGGIGFERTLGASRHEQAQRFERTRNSVSAADVALAARLFDRHVLSSLPAGIFSSAQRCGV